MKTPDKIKKGLVFCTTGRCPGDKCPYFTGDSDASCGYHKSKDALAYIQQLETNNHQLLTKVKQLQRERDAAIEYICQSCGICKNLFKEKCTLNISGITDCKLCDSYEWRGAQEGD